MLELLDRYQRLEIALKLIRGRKKKAEHGGYAGGGVMFGYRVKKGKPFTRVQVKRMLDRENFYRGVYTYGQIQTNGKHSAII